MSSGEATKQRSDEGSDADATPGRGSTLRRTALNVVGFAAGLSLFGWIVKVAVEGGDWKRLADTSPWLIAALLGCTVISAVLNGATFWITARPLKHLRFLDLQLLNVVANALNYAPLRLGAIARVAYHVRVDGLTLVQIAAWFAVVGYMVLLMIGSCLFATLFRTQLDWIWMLLVLGQVVAGGLIARTFVGFPIVHRSVQGVDRIVVDRVSLWGGMILRVLDLAAYTGRFAVAMLILDVSLPSATDVVVLAVVALAASLIPFGRLGFREACVALTAARLDLGESQIDSAWAQLALVESMGEALVYVPIGGVGLLWFRQRWRSASSSAAPSDDQRLDVAS